MLFKLCLSSVGALVATGAMALDFASAPGWSFECEVAVVEREGYFPPRKTGAFRLLWPRESGSARLIGQSGTGYDLREMPGYSTPTAHGVAHFYALPQTAAFGVNGDVLRARMVSVRSDGFIALTEHMIEYGDMRAASAEGTCKIAPLKAEDL
ncbi:hypothetical protein E7681_07945 [Thalassobius vesicularis]|uniref:Uncharacterized protein n=1 Tax=Thalassobius vesicularis TaxID=1294297 RepID=A0A4S3M9Y6_9RHOB|nr:hypothetical protein [Thalassobius vesicularis]THD74880.1 hypothetical protein E7681_07945 [Thalassobius vesicularis]